MRAAVFWKVTSTAVEPRRLRLRERVLYPFRWDLPACVRITLPVADVLSHLVADFLVFSVGILNFLYVLVKIRQAVSPERLREFTLHPFIR